MPGGLLDLFGIDPIANRNRKDARYAIETQAKTELEKQRLANQGQIDVTKQTGANAEAIAWVNAQIEDAKRLGVSPDVMNALKAERERLSKTKMEGNQNRAETDVERSLQEQRDAATGSRARGMQPKYQPKALPYGIGPMSGQALVGMMNATNNPILAGMAQLKVANAPAQVDANPDMLRNVMNSEIARAAVPSIQARAASAINTPKGSATSVWTPAGTANQFGAIEQNTIVPSPIPGMPGSISQAESFPESFSPEDMAAAAQLPPPGSQSTSQQPATSTVNPLPGQAPAAPFSFALPPALPPGMSPLLPEPELPRYPTRGAAAAAIQRGELQKAQKLQQEQEAALRYFQTLLQSTK